jgi:hypothetical protein
MSEKPFWDETPAEFASAFSEDAREQAIWVETYSVPGGVRWRVHSYYDGDSIALSDVGMRELLDWLAAHQGDFAEPVMVPCPFCHGAHYAGQRCPVAPRDQDETPEDWQPRPR